jgi:hypothetical protein
MSDKPDRDAPDGYDAEAIAVLVAGGAFSNPRKRPRHFIAGLAEPDPDGSDDAPVAPSAR